MAYTFEQIQSLLPEGYTLLDIPDKDMPTTKMSILHVRCPRNHIWPTARLGNIVRGCRCFQCMKEDRGVNCRLDADIFKQRLNDMGYELLSEWKGYAYNVTIRCLKCKAVRNRTPYNIRATCKDCDLLRRKKEALAKLEERLFITGYKVLNEIDTTLDIAKIRLQIECDNKHTYPVSLKSFVQKESTCRFCQNLARLDLPQIRLRLDPGYSVEGAYVNETSPLTFVCPNGTPYASNWNKYQSGIRCTCEKCGRFNPKKLAPETVHQRMKALRLKWIGSESEYESCNSLLTLQCTANPEHIPFTKKFAHMYAESVYCPDCQQFGISAAEREISSFLRDVGITVELKNRTLGFEIDIYLPDFKTGIEYHGLFYHNELSKNPNYHFRKWDVCNKNGITLVSIFEDEYVKHPRRIQDYLKSLFRKDSLIKITPADCEYGEISKSEALKFYKNFSVLGSPERNALNLISYGFRYGGTLVGVISYSSQCAGVSNEMCIERYAFNPAYLLVNGLNELVESFIRYRKDVVILVYIRDLRYPTLIAPSEFNLTSIIDSQFYFVKGRERKTQYQLRLPYEADISVLVEQRKKEGWVRIYDCGHDVWMKHITRS